MDKTVGECYIHKSQNLLSINHINKIKSLIINMHMKKISWWKYNKFYKYVEKNNIYHFNFINLLFLSSYSNIFVFVIYYLLFFNYFF